MAVITYTSPADKGLKRRIDTRTVPFFIPYAGIDSGTSTAKRRLYLQALLNVQGFDNIGLEYINESTVNSLGTTVKTVNDGVRVPAFNLTVRGNDIATLYALIGLNYLDIASPDLYKDHGVVGALMLLSFDTESKSLLRTDVIHDCAVKVEETPGGTVGSATDQVITFYSDTAKKYTLPAGYIPAFELWYDDGTGTDIVNTDAPDGALLVFNLGTGNQSYSTTINPAAVAIEANSALTGYHQNFYKIFLDGVEQTTAQVVYAAGSPNKITFTTAPADGAVLFVSYVVELASFDMPGLRADLNPTGGAFVAWNNALAATS